MIGRIFGWLNGPGLSIHSLQVLSYPIIKKLRTGEFDEHLRLLIMSTNRCQGIDRRIIIPIATNSLQPTH